MAPKQVVLQPLIWTVMFGLPCSASQDKARALFGLAVWGTSCTTTVHGFQMVCCIGLQIAVPIPPPCVWQETGLQLVTDDDDVTIGEGQGRRGGGALVQTSGTFTLSSGNRRRDAQVFFKAVLPAALVLAQGWEQ